MLAACVKTSAQPAPPPPPQVTVANVIERDVTEWDEFTGRLQAVDSVEVRPRVSGFVSAVRFSEGAMVRKGDLLFQIDPRPFQAEVDRLRAELTRAQATVQRANSEFARADRLRDAERDLERGPRSPRFVRAGIRRAGGGRRSRVAGRGAQSRVHAGHLADQRSRLRAIVTEGNLVSSGPGEATLLTTVVSLDPVYAYFDADEQIYLKYTAGGDKTRNRSSIDRRIRMALANEEGFPREGELDFLDNQLDNATGTIRGRAVFRNTDGRLTPGLFVRLRLAGTGKYHGVLIQDRAVGTDLSKKFVYVVSPKHEIEYRAGDARSDRQRPARRSQRTQGGRADRGQRTAAHPAGRAGHAARRPDGRDPNSEADAARYGRNNSDERNQPATN